MIDEDGIQRPENSDSHAFEVPKGRKVKLDKKKDFKNSNPIVRFFGYLLRILVFLIFTPAFFFLYRLKVNGKHNLKAIKKSGGIIVMNHCHYLDSVMCAVKSMPKTVWYAALYDNFQMPLVGGIIKALAAIPIPYELSKMRTFKKVIDESLQNGEIIGFMPECALWHNYRSLRPFKIGAFRFAAQNEKPVLPVVITIKIHHKSASKKKYRLTLSYLEPIYPDNSISKGEASEKLKQAAFDAMNDLIVNSKNNDTYSKKFLQNNPSNP